MANVGSATLTIVPSAKGFQNSLEREINGPLAFAGKKGGQDAGKAAGAGLMGGLLPVAGKIVPVLGAALGSLAVGSYIKDSIGSASDLNETLSKTATVLGKKATPSVLKFGDAASSALGLSKREALDAVSTFAIFGKGAGLQGKELGKFGTDLTTLAADFASFYNTSPEDAITAIGSALRGENEAIRRYGVLLDNATLQNRAFKMGLTESNKQALTPQQKVLAAQAEILRQSKVAQGDVERTSGGLANTQRRFAAGMENLKAAFGNAFLPLATKVVGVFADKILPAVTSFVNAVSPVFASLGEALGSIFGGSGASDAIKGVSKIGSAFSGQAGAFSGFADTMKSIGEALSIVGGLIRDYVLPAAQTVGEAFAGFLGEAFRAIGEIMSDTIAPAARDLANAFKEFAPKVAPLIGFLAKLWAAWMKLYYGALGKVLVVIIKIAAIIGGILINGITGLIMAISSAIDFVSNFGDSWRRLVDTVKGRVAAMIAFVKGIPAKIRSVFASAGAWLTSAGRNIVQGLINGIKSLASAPVDAIKNVAGAVVDGAKSLLRIQSPSKVFVEIGKFVGEGFAKGIVASRAEVVKKMRGLAKLVAKSGNDGLEKVVGKSQDRLVRLAKRRDGLIRRLDFQKNRLQDLLSEKSSYFDSVRSGLLEEGTLANNGGSFDAIIRRFETAVSLSKKFDTSLKALSKAGLDPALVRQIGEMGAREGIPTAGLILSKGPDGVAALNALQKDLAISAKSTAKATSGAVFDQSIASAKGMIAGFESQVKPIEAAMTKIANALVAAVRKALGLKGSGGKGGLSSVGSEAVAAIAKGADTSVNVAGKKARPAARVAVPNGAAPARDRGRGTVNITINNPKPETAGKSIQRNMAKIAALGVYG